MPVTDPVADMLTRIRNALRVRRAQVDVPGSKVKLGIASVLKEEGFIRDFRFIEDDRQGIIRLYLKYGRDGEEVIRGLKRVSRPGRRVYRKYDEIEKVLGGLGVAILSTSKGVMSDKKCRRDRAGGELLCIVW